MFMSVLPGNSISTPRASGTLTRRSDLCTVRFSCYFTPTRQPNLLSPNAANASPKAGLAVCINLGHCSELEPLYIGANPAFLTYERDGSADLVAALLRSWRPKRLSAARS